METEESKIFLLLQIQRRRQLKLGFLDFFRFDQRNAEDANRVFTCRGQAKARGKRLRGDQTGLEENLIVR